MTDFINNPAVTASENVEFLEITGGDSVTAGGSSDGGGGDGGGDGEAAVGNRRKRKTEI